MEIREAQMRDYYGVMTTLSDGFDDRLYFTMDEFDRYISQDQLRCYVGIQDGRVICVHSMLFERKLLHNGSIVAHLEDFAIRKGYRGQGYGPQMLEHVISEAKNAGCYKVIHTACSELVPYYEKHSGTRIHDISMRRDL